MPSGVSPRTLSLLRTTPPLNISKYRDLQILDLTRCAWTISWVHLFEVLRSCTDSLEQLILSRSLSHLTGSPSAPSSPIILGKLHTLKLDAPHIVLEGLLPHLRLPSLSRIDIRDDASEIAEDINDTTATFSTMLPPTLRPPFLSSVTDIAFMSMIRMYHLIGNTADERTSVSLELYTDRDVGYSLEPATQGGLDGVVEIFGSFASVTSLDLNVDFSECVTAENLEPVLRAFPLLQAVVLSGRPSDDDESFSKVLRLFAPRSSSSQGGSANDIDILCPNLQSLTIGGEGDRFAGYDEPFDLLLEILEARTEHGARRLSNLTIYHMIEEEEEYMELRDQYVPLLKAHVDDVAYHLVEWEEYNYERDTGID